MFLGGGVRGFTASTHFQLVLTASIEWLKRDLSISFLLPLPAAIMDSSSETLSPNQPPSLSFSWSDT